MTGSAAPDCVAFVIGQTAEVLRGAFGFVAALAVNELVRHYIANSVGGKWAYAIVALVCSVFVSLCLLYFEHGYEQLKQMQMVGGRRGRHMYYTTTEDATMTGAPKSLAMSKDHRNPVSLDRPYPKLGI